MPRKNGRSRKVAAEAAAAAAAASTTTAAASTTAQVTSPVLSDAATNAALPARPISPVLSDASSVSGEDRYGVEMLLFDVVGSISEHRRRQLTLHFRPDSLVECLHALECRAVVHGSFVRPSLLTAESDVDLTAYVRDADHACRVINGIATFCEAEKQPFAGVLNLVKFQKRGCSMDVLFVEERSQLTVRNGVDGMWQRHRVMRDAARLPVETHQGVAVWAEQRGHNIPYRPAAAALMDGVDVSSREVAAIPYVLLRCMNAAWKKLGGAPVPSVVLKAALGGAGTLGEIPVRAELGQMVYQVVQAHNMLVAFKGYNHEHVSHTPIYGSGFNAMMDACAAQCPGLIAGLEDYQLGKLDVYKMQQRHGRAVPVLDGDHGVLDYFAHTLVGFGCAGRSDQTRNVYRALLHAITAPVLTTNLLTLAAVLAERKEVPTFLQFVHMCDPTHVMDTAVLQAQMEIMGLSEETRRLISRHNGIAAELKRVEAAQKRVLTLEQGTLRRKLAERLTGMWH